MTFIILMCPPPPLKCAPCVTSLDSLQKVKKKKADFSWSLCLCPGDQLDTQRNLVPLKSFLRFHYTIYFKLCEEPE